VVSIFFTLIKRGGPAPAYGVAGPRSTDQPSVRATLSAHDLHAPDFANNAIRCYGYDEGVYTVECPTCGNEADHRRKDGVFCTDLCRARAWRAALQLDAMGGSPSRQGRPATTQAPERSRPPRPASKKSRELAQWRQVIQLKVLAIEVLRRTELGAKKSETLQAFVARLLQEVPDSGLPQAVQDRAKETARRAIEEVVRTAGLN
jgi:hypothetical protein